MSQSKRLAEVEWEIMVAVWQLDNPVTVRDVHSHLYPEGEKAYTTVQTIMNILAEKGFLRKQKTGMVNFYTPTLSREDAAEVETRSFASRLFEGSFGTLATYLIASGELSGEEMRQLKALIDAKEREKNEGGV